MLISHWTNPRQTQTITIEQTGANQFAVILAGSCSTSYRVDTLARAEHIAQGMQDATIRDDLLKDVIGGNK